MFNLCFPVFDTNFGHLRIQYSVPIFTQECDNYSLPLLTLLFLPQITSISSLPFSSQSNSVNLCGCLVTENTLGTESCVDLSLSS